LRVTVLETGDAAQDVLSGYRAALLNSDIVVGPLSRSGVAAVAQSGAVIKPTIALAQAEAQDDIEIVLPPKMLVMGLSIEEQARQVADAARADGLSGKAFVVSADIGWQRRAAKALAARWSRRGREAELMELTGSGRHLDAKAIMQLKKRIQTEKPAVLFAALDAEQARQMREAIGQAIPLYGTAQLNPWTLQDWAPAERIPELNGARLVDMPWQLQPDHPAVMVYPRLAANPDHKRSVDMERLYALGIDAYRVAREIASNRTQFEIDGVTGKLIVTFGRGAARFERVEPTAIYRDGAVVPLVGPR
jgi:outer membrane PBP1 activator LpoA protein